MPRRRSKRSKTREAKEVQQESGESTSKGVKQIRKRRTRRRAYRKKVIDIDSLTKSIAGEVASALGLDLLGLSDEELVEVLRPAIEAVVGESSYKPSTDTIISRLRRYYTNIAKIISMQLLRLREKLTPEQLEFIILNGEEVAGLNAPRLYQEILRCKRLDLLGNLRMLWERYGRPTPFTCPKCGFRAITPDLTCIICGSSVSEKELKKSIDFREKLVEFGEEASISEIKEVLEKGYVLMGEYVKPPSARRSPYDIELFLTSEEKKILSSILKSKIESLVSKI